MTGKRIDALFDPQSVVLQYVAKTYGISDQTKILKLPAKPIGSYTVFSKKSVEKEIVDQYESALKKATEKMPYEQFLTKWYEPAE